MPTESFKSAEAYRRYNAYTHMHHIPTHIQTAVIAGKPHKVKHSDPGDRQSHYREAYRARKAEKNGR